MSDYSSKTTDRWRQTVRMFTDPGRQRADLIRPNALRDLHASLLHDLTDAEFRMVVMKWLEGVTYAE